MRESIQPAGAVGWLSSRQRSHQDRVETIERRRSASPYPHPHITHRSCSSLADSCCCHPPLRPPPDLPPLPVGPPEPIVPGVIPAQPIACPAPQQPLVHPRLPPHLATAHELHHLIHHHHQRQQGSPSSLASPLLPPSHRGGLLPQPSAPHLAWAVSPAGPVVVMSEVVGQAVVLARQRPPTSTAQTPALRPPQTDRHAPRPLRSSSPSSIRP